MATSGPTKRACDECHAVKEKCRRSDPSAVCERCSRIGQYCQTVRCAVKPGRKSKMSKKVPYTLPTSSASIALTSFPTCEKTALSLPCLSWNSGLASNPMILSDLDPVERHFLNLMKDILAPSPLDKFLVCPSFHESDHSLFIQNIIQPTSVVRNATVACAAVFFRDQLPEYSKPSVEIGHRRAALALSALRSFKISGERDLVTALILGVAMVTFAMHVAEGQPYLISHYTLSLIKSQHMDLSTLDPSMIGFLMCLTSTETFECLLRSSIPTMRVDLDGKDRVDRYLGLSSPILTYFYDICEISCSIRHAKAVLPEILQRLNAIHAGVDQWQPSTPVDFLDHFTQAEVVAILAQSRVLRLAALLIIRRLYHPYGQYDLEAVMLSQAIIGEFEMVLQLTQRSIPCTELAYLVSCFELLGTDSRIRAIERSEHVITFSKQMRLRFQIILGSIWNARDRGCKFYWFELNDYVDTLGIQ
ncbi:hypothetical protein BGW36DRAFT_69898 [Talaromyces proteolyticus]|uniref:Zn(2)-C6 fungal-type domain-containing protein n=1 Tax=Talaromyces proteolyticus TaxID=1131652 RepID=A0AAD4KK82_9EURO|nr:uncharacterized protein BGW36DRAFT_69898 [Talaromyces proteolyticus]KAH8690346.1 hypothetical protein BGW36DRAFT_69898 [Talaromyces proteolyticus]